MGRNAITPESLKADCAKRKAARKIVGRPKGGNLMVNIFQQKIDNGDVAGAFDAILAVAKDPNHKHWGAAIKIVADRAAHISHFEKENSGGQTPVVNINIGVAEPKGIVIDSEP
jgi:hypothetical protein